MVSVRPDRCSCLTSKVQSFDTVALCFHPVGQVAECVGDGTSKATNSCLEIKANESTHLVTIAEELDGSADGPSAACEERYPRQA